MNITMPTPHDDALAAHAWSGIDLILAPQPEQPARPRGHAGRGRRDEVRPVSEAVPRFDFADLIRRARRNVELSQRELAAMIGVSKSTVARAEADTGTVSLPVLLAALAVGGIDLIAVDGDGEVFPMRLDALRDRGGRKLPAHLEARVASESENVPAHWSGSDRRNAPVRWHLRSRRRLMQVLSWQHPGPEDVAIVRRRDADERAFRQIVAQIRADDARRRAEAGPTLDPCCCSDECIIQGTTCPPTCPCGCESARPPTLPNTSSLPRRDLPLAKGQVPTGEGGRGAP